MTGRRPFFRPRLASSGAASVASREGDDGSGLTAEQARRFRETIRPHRESAYNVARSLTRDPIAAEDVVQEAFLRAFRSFAACRADAPKAWLFAIVRNCFLNWSGARQGPGRVFIDEGALSETQAAAMANVADPGQATPEDELLRRRDAQAVRAVIENLPEPFRETLVLREMEELAYKDIAALTGAPIGTVMSRLARAREMLGEMLSPLREADDVEQRKITS